MLSVAFVLVRPQQARNLGQTARALANQGFDDLRLVQPGPQALATDAWVAARGARSILDRAQHHETLAAAVLDRAWVFGTSARTRSATGEAVRGWAARRAQLPGGDRIAVVFGPERTGLTREELAVCHGLVRIPTASEAAALNLAQAVLIVAYELRLAEAAGPGAAAPPAAATVGALEELLAHWVEAMRAVGYLRSGMPGERRRVAALRGLLRRADPGAGELELLRGLARQISWAGDVARATDSQR